MTKLLRHFRGIGVALIVLAVSAGAAFAAAPRFAPVSDTGTVTEVTESTSETTTESTGTTETTTDTTETTTVGDGDEDGDEGDGTTTTTTETSSDDAAVDTHGELVSFAAAMATPANFPNHGAFVSCVAKMGQDVTLATIDWLTVTPESCGIAPKADKATGAKTKAQEHKTKAQGHKAKARTHGKPKG